MRTVLPFLPLIVLYILLGGPSEKGATAQVPPAPAVGSPAPTVQDKIAFRRKTLHSMKDELSQVADLVKSEQFRSAQALFEKALKNWYIFGGTIKRIAPESYAKILPGFDKVKRGLYQSSVPLSTLKSNLQALIQDVSIALPISDAQD